jgi:hypothetical protein
MTSQPLPTIESVDITPGEYGFLVEPVYGGVDRPRACGYWAAKLPLANRLKAAILAGKAITVNGTGTDVNGQTYADDTAHFLCRRLNADLKRLGF